MKREKRYIVLKLKDILAALTEDEQYQMQALAARVSVSRYMRGASDLKCVVVEHDWPEYEPTWDAITRRMDGTQMDNVPNREIEPPEFDIV